MTSHILEMIHTHQENRVLKEKIREDLLLRAQWQESQSENDRLRRLLDMKTALPFQTVSARVAGRDSQSWTQSLWIDRGIEDGIRAQSPVLAVGNEENGNVSVVSVIGRVLECGPRLSKVLLITDPLSSIAVSLSRTGEQGIAQGQGGLSVTVDYLDRGADVLEGEDVRTSGLGGVFPAGLNVGKIREIVPSASEFKRAVVKPSISLTKVREVLVLLK